MARSILEKETICFCSEEEEERLYRFAENGDLRNMKEILSSGKVRFNKVYRIKELICGEDRMMVGIYLLYSTGCLNGICRFAGVR